VGVFSELLAQNTDNSGRVDLTDKVFAELTAAGLAAVQHTAVAVVCSTVGLKIRRTEEFLPFCAVHRKG
jgi:hypothetical protein